MLSSTSSPLPAVMAALGDSLIHLCMSTGMSSIANPSKYDLVCGVIGLSWGRLVTCTPRNPGQPAESVKPVHYILCLRVGFKLNFAKIVTNLL